MTDTQETLRPAFTGRPTPQISHGLPFATAAAHHAQHTFHAQKVYVMISGSLARNTSSLTQLQEALGDRLAGVRVGMQSHTLWSEVLEIVHDARGVGADLLLTVGGGSLTDGAKVVALALANNVQNTTDLSTLDTSPLRRTTIHPPTIPIISIPTSLSAGEYSNFAGATHDLTRRKHSFQAPLKGPQLIILDPVLAATTPPHIWLSTGIRAVDHCVETAVAVQNTSPATDQLALAALGRLVPGLLACKKDRGDREAYLACQLGSVDAMAACTTGEVAVQLGASHGIGHQLGPLGVGHGETSCILLPAVCKFNARHNANTARQTIVRDFLLAQPVVAEALTRRGGDVSTADLGDVLDAVIRELGMPRSLHEVNVGRDQLDALAANSLHDRWCKSNPVPLQEKSQVLEILEMVV